MSSPGSLDIFLHAARTRVDEALERYLPRPPACPALISDAMRYSVFAGGKRLRPCLTLAAADAAARRSHALRPFDKLTVVLSPVEGRHVQAIPSVSTDDGPRGIDLALPAACAIELIHTYSLIHDDLPAMDNDTLRRGRPTLHVVYGDGIAILTGDGLQAEAFALLAREPVGTEAPLVLRKLRVLQTIGDAARSTGLVGGQAIDLQAAGQGGGHAMTLDGEGLRAMHAKKTGALIRASAVSGAIMAFATDDLVDAIDRYAADLGLAFQIVDDILDVEGNARELGKTAGKDESGAKPTYPALFGLERSRSLAADCVARSKQTLVDAGVTEGWLAPIADWVVARRN